MPSIKKVCFVNFIMLKIPAFLLLCQIILSFPAFRKGKIQHKKIIGAQKDSLDTLCLRGNRNDFAAPGLQNLLSASIHNNKNLQKSCCCDFCDFSNCVFSYSLGRLCRHYAQPVTISLHFVCKIYLVSNPFEFSYACVRSTN